MNNLGQVIWSSENYKWEGHLNLFSRTKVKSVYVWWIVCFPAKMPSCENYLKAINRFQGRQRCQNCFASLLIKESALKDRNMLPKGSTLKEKNLLSTAAIFFPFWVNPFSEVTKCISLLNKMICFEGQEVASKDVYSKRKEFAPLSKFFPFWVDPFFRSHKSCLPCKNGRTSLKYVQSPWNVIFHDSLYGFSEWILFDIWNIWKACVRCGTSCDSPDEVSLQMPCHIDYSEIFSPLSFSSFWIGHFLSMYLETQTKHCFN